MKFKSGIILFSALAAISATSTAATLDYRHEYTDESRVHKDRLRFSHRFANQIGVAVEAKSKNNKDEAYHNGMSGGSEVELNYQHKVNDAFTLSPAITLDLNDKGTKYMFALRGGYKITDSFSASVRYRYEVQDMSDSEKSGPNQHAHRGDLNLDYKWGDYKLGYNFVYKDTDFIAYNNKKYDYENNLKLEYSLSKAWVPYVELGEVKVSSKEDDRQLRYRLGVKYNF